MTEYSQKRIFILLLTVLIFCLGSLSCSKESRIERLKRKAYARIDKAFNDYTAEQAVLTDVSNRSYDSSLYKKYDGALAEADLLLEKAFELGRDSYSLPLEFFRKYYEIRDFRRAREWIIRSRRAANYYPELITDMARTNDTRFRLLMIETMGYMNDVSFIPPLSEIITNTTSTNTDEVAELCFAIESLGRIGDRRSIPLLEEYYRHQIWGIRLLAGQALEKITGEDYPVEMPDKKTQRN